MKTNKELMASLKKDIDRLAPFAEDGSTGEHVEWAMACALYEFLEQGYLLTDLGWFKGTTYYTGDRFLTKAA